MSTEVSLRILSRKSRRSAAQSSASENVAESFAKVRVEIGVDARIDAGRQITEPRERGKHVGRHLARSAQSVGEVGAEERQPENDECQEDPDESSLRSTLPAVDLHPRSAADPERTCSSGTGAAADRSTFFHAWSLSFRRSLSSTSGLSSRSGLVLFGHALLGPVPPLTASMLM